LVRKTTDRRPTDSAVPAKCTSCDRPLDSPIVCLHCHNLQPEGAGVDHFQLFGLPRSYRIDLNELRDKFLSISRNIHPDRFAQASAEMQAVALRLSSQLNEAYEALRDPFRRAEYLLQTSGGCSAAEDKSVPEGLLAHILAVREQLEQAKADGDEKTLTSLRQQTLAEREAISARIAELADRLVVSADEATRDELRKQLNAAKYIENLLNQF